jgi:diguanylate cyclase (GGDEF)-like protein
VDDEEDTRRLLGRILKTAGYDDVLTASSALEAYRQLGVDGRPELDEGVDLILMDVTMPGVDGIEASSRIKGTDHLVDIPVIIVTGRSEPEALRVAFDAGVTDYVTKPFNRVELLARVRAALRLKQEMDRRKARERELLEVTEQLEAANQQLRRISQQDGLTGLANRRHFDEVLELEWRRSAREHRLVALIMIDIDYFKLYNDGYGHLQGDQCLKSVASTLASRVRRPGDLVARYGGEEFVVLLPDTDQLGAAALADVLRQAVYEQDMEHRFSQVVPRVTISLGVAARIAQPVQEPSVLIDLADHALYLSKDHGRNQYTVATDAEAAAEPTAVERA